MKREDAIRLNHLYARIGAELNQSARFRLERDPDYDANGGAQPTGTVMATLLEELMNPLWADFPDLLPTGMGGPYTIPSEVYEGSFYRHGGNDPADR